MVRHYYIDITIGGWKLSNSLEYLRKKFLCDEPDITPVRRTGRSTRLIDEYIQELFRGRRILVKDHYGTRQSDELLWDDIMDRLYLEHKHLFGRDLIEKSQIALTIKILPDA